MKFLLILIFISTAWASSFNESELTELADKKVILKASRLKSSDPWPEIHARAYFQLSPRESIAFFARYEHQKTYIPNLLESKITKQISPREAHVYYEMDMPWPVPNSEYVHGHILKREGDEYTVSWYLVESDSAEVVKGKAIFVPWNGGTLMKYQAFVRPKSFFAGLFESTMQEDVRKSLIATIEAAQKFKNSSPKQFNKFLVDFDRSIKR